MSDNNQCNCSNTPQSTGFGQVATGGVQDVSAILPLLGTDQCERHVSCAMERGFFYVAATPMSIFGSLGIVKAGFTALWISFDSTKFHGPRQLQNSGFDPTSTLQKLMYAFDTNDSVYVAEQMIRNILYPHEVTGVTVNLLSWPWLRWNIMMVLFTTLLSSLGFIPYILIIRDLPGRPLVYTWMYPILRVFGSSMTAIALQLLVQLRLLYVIHGRARFMAISRLLSETQGSEVPTLKFWNSETRSNDCLSQLRSAIIEDSSSRPSYLEKLLNEDPRDIGSFVSFQTSAVQPTGGYSRRKSFNFLFFRALLYSSRFFLLLGMVATLIGYVGCFSLIQATTNSHSPLIWLAAEVSLSFIRLIIWAWNPDWDDPPPPIALRRVRSKSNSSRNTITYDVTWTLDAVTADDVHALIIAIDTVRLESGSGMGDAINLQGAVTDARDVEVYLKDDLAVPEHQITMLLNEFATASTITRALENLATNSSIRRDAPIIIYIASHSIKAGVIKIPPEMMGVRSARVPEATAIRFLTSDFKPSDPNSGLPYSQFFELLQRISRNKGENITVMIDTCFADYIRDAWVNFPYNANGVLALLQNYPTHTLLAACASNQQTHEIENGGVFTQALLKELRAPYHDRESMTWMGLTQKIENELKKQRRDAEAPHCYGTFRNRLIFNGLLSKNTKRSSEYDDPSTSAVVVISTQALETELLSIK